LCYNGALGVHVFVKGGPGDVDKCGLVVFIESFRGVFVPPFKVGWKLCVWVTTFGVIRGLVPGGRGGVIAAAAAAVVVGIVWCGVFSVGCTMWVIVPWAAFGVVAESAAAAGKSFVARSTFSCSVLWCLSLLVLYVCGSGCSGRYGCGCRPGMFCLAYADPVIGVLRIYPGVWGAWVGGLPNACVM
jgi:hypothetical protein